MPLSSDGDPERRATRVALARGAPVAATYAAATRSVNIWDTQAGALRSTRPVGEIVALALGSRGERLAIIDHEMKLVVLSTASGEELARAQLDRRRIAARKTTGLAMAPDETTIAVNRVTHVEIWRLTAEEHAPENLRLERVLLLPVATLDCRVPVAFSADGSRLAAGCDSAVVWETNTWRELVRLVPDAKGRIGGAPAWIDEGFAFSADGRAVLTTHGVWDVPDPAPAATE